ncbi:fimbria/pilus outer membrane usher protein, partial [Proteus mirabilis]|uniref:fimbria/pilus outer membrane usher protein n=1 Tax=Proteus mirabilis TaxID=584 RepID=UPI001E302693|nr:fimbria/pilus outer membrane usher protein [Proteus mirabilis]
MMCGNIKLPLLSVVACEERLVLIPAMPLVFTIAKVLPKSGAKVIPLTNSSQSYHWVSNQFDYHPNNKGYINSTTIGGSLLEHYRLGYSINYRRDFSHPNAGYHTSVNTQYKGRYQSYSINANKSSNNKTNLRLGIDGAIVLHQSGITLAPDLGNTFAIVNT